jgi:hypothetical protein
MNTCPKHQRWISGLLLVSSVVSLLLFLQPRYFPTPPDMDGQALTAALSSGHSMYELFARGAMQRSHLSDLSRSLVPAILVLTVALALWTFGLWRRQTKS